MRSFETVVRPVVFPNIRPAPAQPVSPSDDPDKGFAVIHGNGGKQVDLSYSYSSSTTSSAHSEIRRRVDRVRVYQKNEDGTINKSNFLDLEVANKYWMKGPTMPTVDSSGPGVGTPALVAPQSGGSGTNTTLYYYERVREQDNVEIKDRDMIKESGN